MSNIKNSRGASQPEITKEPQWVPDVYFFPVQVRAELGQIQNDFLGKTLTIIETLNLTPKQEKATKDLIRTVVKEQMNRSKAMLDGRLGELIQWGMQPINSKDSRSSFFFESEIDFPGKLEEKVEL